MAGDTTGAGDREYGRLPEQWEEVLSTALERGERAELEALLLELRKEMRDERDALARREAGPFLDRLMEHARGLLTSEPTETEALRMELSQERSRWAAYRQRYRDAFVPMELHPFLKSCGVFLRPVTDGVQYPDFQKYSGCSDGQVREAVTLFWRPQQESEGIPHYFSSFDHDGGTCVVYRAYRFGMPRGSGAECILELIRTQVPDLTKLRFLKLDNVEERVTYDAHVAIENGVPTLRPNVEASGSPLGRLAQRLLDRLGLKMKSYKAFVDDYGFLDLLFEVE